MEPQTRVELHINAAIMDFGRIALQTHTHTHAVDRASELPSGLRFDFFFQLQFLYLIFKLP